MEVCVFIIRCHHASSTHSYSGSSRMCAIHTHISHVRSIVPMSNCHNNSQTVRCFCIDTIVMDLPVVNVDNPFSASRCCNYLPTTLIVCIESTEDSLWCYNTCVSVQCYSIIGWVTISVIVSCLCRGLAQFCKNSPSLVICLVSQLILMDVAEGSNSTLPSSNVPVLSIMSITSVLITGCVLVAGVTRMGLAHGLAPTTDNLIVTDNFINPTSVA